MLIFICPNLGDRMSYWKTQKTVSKLVSIIARKVTQIPKFGLHRENELSFRNDHFITMLVITYLIFRREVADRKIRHHVQFRFARLHDEDTGQTDLTGIES